MTPSLYTTAAPRRNSHHIEVDRTDPPLTAGGKVIYLRTRRPVSTCNLLANVAGLGSGEAR